MTFTSWQDGAASQQDRNDAAQGGDANQDAGASGSGNQQDATGHAANTQGGDGQMTQGDGEPGHVDHGAEHGAEHGMDIKHFMDHVGDAYYFEVPHFMAPPRQPPSYLKHAEPNELQGKILIPQPFATLRDLHTVESGFAISKMMVVQAFVAVMMILVFVWLARKIKSGNPVKGRLANLLEAMLLFVRDNVARPAIGEHDADRFLPFLWTLFFFIVSCNVIGMFPWLGTATGILSTTAALAAITFLVVVFSGMFKLGAVGFWKAQVPHMDLSPAIAMGLKPLIFGIEVGGLFIKHTVLAVRLLANMFAGHLVLAVIIGFIAQTEHSALWYGITPASVLGSAALGLLELFVAFLQAYIFTFLASLFIGMAVHPH